MWVLYVFGMHHREYRDPAFILSAPYFIGMSLFSFLRRKAGLTQDDAVVRGTDRASTFFLLAILFLLPIFFIPSISFSFVFTKATILSLLTLVSLALWLVARLWDGRFIIPSSPMLLALALFAGLFALSSLFSGDIAFSFFGQGFEVGTAVNMLIGGALAFLVSAVFRTSEHVIKGYVAFFASFVLIALFHILRLVFGPDFLAFGLFTDTVSNTVGKLNDLGIFFGVSALFSLLTIELISLTRVFKVILWLALLTSLFFLMLVNFWLLWLILGLFSLIFLVLLLSFGQTHTPVRRSAEDEILFGEPHFIRKVPLPSLVVLLISVVFILGGNTIGEKMGSVFTISQNEARLSWGSTVEVVKETLQVSPLLGAGPNKFISEWQKYKPEGINTTVFWNIDFAYGSGLVPTFTATSGILGALAWLIFFLLFLISGFRAVLSEISDTLSRYLLTSSFFIALFLWVFSILYIPSLTIFALTFIFTGLFIASLSVTRMLAVKTILFASSPRVGFVSILALILLLMGSIALGYTLVQKYIASVFFQKGVISFNVEGNLDVAEKHITRATLLNPQDIYYRFLTELALIRMNKLVSQNDPKMSAEMVRSAFQTLLTTALASAKQAVALGPTNYENQMTLGRVFEAVVPLKIDGAYENAKRAYTDALTLNPKSPAILLTIARLEVTKGDNVKARESINSALKEKANYTEAVFLLSQIEAQEGNIKGAIASAEAAATFSPDDPTVLFQLGLLRFNDKNYTGAITALEKSIAHSPTYANAKYFLGLSYAKVNRNADALAQFTDLKEKNPDNKDIEQILKNLEASKDPFYATPPATATPGKNLKLPVEEKNVQTPEV